MCGPIISLGDGRFKRMRVTPNRIMKGPKHVITFERIEDGNTQGL